MRSSAADGQAPYRSDTPWNATAGLVLLPNAPSPPPPPRERVPTPPPHSPTLFYISIYDNSPRKSTVQPTSDRGRGDGTRGRNQGRGGVSYGLCSAAGEPRPVVSVERCWDRGVLCVRHKGRIQHVPTTSNLVPRHPLPALVSRCFTRIPAVSTAAVTAAAPPSSRLSRFSLWPVRREYEKCKKLTPSTFIHHRQRSLFDFGGGKVGLGTRGGAKRPRHRSATPRTTRPIRTGKKYKTMQSMNKEATSTSYL